METTQPIGVDLHRNCFTACIRLEKGRNYVKGWKLEQLPKFVAKLRASDEVAVEVTRNRRLFPHCWSDVVCSYESACRFRKHTRRKSEPIPAHRGWRLLFCHRWRSGQMSVFLLRNHRSFQSFQDRHPDAITNTQGHVCCYRSEGPGQWASYA